MANGIERRFDDFVSAEVLDTGRRAEQARTLDISRYVANFRPFADLIGNNPEVDDTFDETFEEMLTAARDRISIAAEKGYALRAGGEPERTTTIAVPVIVFSTAVGALCTSFPTSEIKLEEACTKYVPELLDAARSIAVLFEK